MNERDYNLMIELDLYLENGMVLDTDTGNMIFNPYTQKYLIKRVGDSYVDWNHYEEFDPCNNFKQLKALVEYYVGKISVRDDLYIPIIGTDMKSDGTIAISCKAEDHSNMDTRIFTISSNYFPKEESHLAYIDFIFALNGSHIEDYELPLYKRDEFKC